MADTKTIALPNGLMAEVERIAEAQQRSVDEVFKEAVERYISREEFKEVLSFGARHARSRGLTPADVGPAIAKAREQVVSATADTNIYISALNFGGNPRTFLELAEAGKFRLAISGAILAEIGKVLRGDTFAWPEAEIERAQRQIARFAQHVEPVETVEVIKIDPPDNRILECAAAARSDYIVSGDKHLLRVKSFRDMPVVKVATFLDLVAKHARGQTL